MHRMRLGFYLEETGRSQTDLANEIGRDRKVKSLEIIPSYG